MYGGCPLCPLFVSCLKCIPLIDDKDANFQLDRKKIFFFSQALQSSVLPGCNAYRGSIVTFLAWRYNSRETTGSPSSKYEHRRQTTLLRNIRNIRICMGKKPIVSVTYENERISIKNSLPYLERVLRRPRADLWPFYGFLCKPFSLPGTTQERRNTHFK